MRCLRSEADLHRSGIQSRNGILARREDTFLRNNVDIIGNVLRVELQGYARLITSSKHVPANRQILGEVARHASAAAVPRDVVMIAFARLMLMVRVPVPGWRSAPIFHHEGTPQTCSAVAVGNPGSKC